MKASYKIEGNAQKSVSQESASKDKDSGNSIVNQTLDRRMKTLVSIGQGKKGYLEAQTPLTAHRLTDWNNLNSTIGLKQYFAADNTDDF